MRLRLNLPLMVVGEANPKPGIIPSRQLIVVEVGPQLKTQLGVCPIPP